jgi:hypothetical protein
VDESEGSAMPRVRNYVRTGVGPNDWMVITMAENEADMLERLGGRCDPGGANVAMTVGEHERCTELSTKSAQLRVTRP